MFNFIRRSTQALPLPVHTDIHCHILPGIDDGARTPQDGADLVERLQGWGITRIIASPHISLGAFENTIETIDQARRALQAELQTRGNTMVIEASSENRIDDMLMGNLAQGGPRPYPGQYLLIENSFISEPFHLDQLVFDLKIKGFKPILAHPERYSYYHRKPRRYEQLHEAGLRFQINALSLSDYYGGDERRWAEWMLDHNLVDFLGTDMHNQRHAASIDAWLASRTYQRRHLPALQAQCQNDTAFPTL